MNTSHLNRLSAAELEAEAGALLPDKEVLSVPLLDLNVDIDLALALAAPIDLAVAANANAALPIQGAVSADVLTSGSTSGASAGQNVMLDQLIRGSAIAQGDQSAAIDQTHDDLGTGGDEAGAASVMVAPFTGLGSGDTIEPRSAATDAAAGPVPDNIDDTLNNIDDTLNNVNDTLDNVNGTLDDVDGTLADVNGTLADVDGTLDTVNGTLDGVNDTVGNLNGTLDGVNDTIGNLNGTLGAVNETLAGLEGVINPVNETLNNALEGGLLNVDVQVGLDADLAAPIAGAVAANANVAAPVSAAVSANIGTIDSDSIALASQNAVISQHLEDVVAQATVNQDSTIDQ
jgi:archaellum component FlaC